MPPSFVGYETGVKAEGTSEKKRERRPRDWQGRFKPVGVRVLEAESDKS